MATVAIYSLKGGVGKTTLAVNLAWCAAQSGRRTLLWDLDPQAAATWLVSGEREGGSMKRPRDAAQSVFAREVAPERLIAQTATPRLDLLHADASLRGLDQFLFELGKRKRLRRLLDDLTRDYDRIVLDCPPGLTPTSAQVLRAADIIIVPVIPSPLSRRALDTVVAYLARENGRHAPILPVFSMVDRRRSLHRAALEGDSDWPVVPMASAIEQMTVRRAPVGSYAGGAAADAFAQLWVGIERRLAQVAD